MQVLPTAWMGGFPLVPSSPRVSLYPSGPFRAHDFFYDLSITILLIHFTRSESGQHGLMATLLTAAKVRCTCFTIIGSNVVDWNVVLPEERDGIGDLKTLVLAQIQSVLALD